jgi:hypothetical protein
MYLYVSISIHGAHSAPLNMRVFCDWFSLNLPRLYGSGYGSRHFSMLCRETDAW